MNDDKFALDDKVQAMVSLLDDIKAYPYAPDTKRKILDILDKKGIPYLLDELPEDLPYGTYVEKLDDYIVKLIKKEIK